MPTTTIIVKKTVVTKGDETVTTIQIETPNGVSTEEALRQANDIDRMTTGVVNNMMSMFESFKIFDQWPFKPRKPAVSEPAKK